MSKIKNWLGLHYWHGLCKQKYSWDPLPPLAASHGVYNIIIISRRISLSASTHPLIPMFNHSYYFIPQAE
ncbi:unnamed protein product [Sphenostylis stenocarpa]|uniref:Uncharacterized protein n=1 Tax=Sphenostylis stenocarpa TaxID=92480 RepID=A0AA86VTG2_9FABA|nr:unnamed protein product [Sphenostylis stenocarpa]